LREGSQHAAPLPRHTACCDPSRETPHTEADGGERGTRKWGPDPKVGAPLASREAYWYAT